jgi:glycosyltransferase involved in cell wall biosynthesis
MSDRPRVSVVIPTLRRPALLARALRSALTQTYGDIEVVVVVDGPDDDTVAYLRTVVDPRLRILAHHRSLTAAGARNAGVAYAKGEWIAFLDDDDEWLPQKLERQIAYAGSGRSSLISCRSHVVTPVASYIWPEEIYDNSTPVDEYLFDRRGAFAGSGYLQTSSYLIPRILFERSPFAVPSQHDDWEFVLHLSKRFGARIDTVPEVLVKTYAEEPRPSLSTSGTWVASLAWLDRVASLLTPRAYSGFCLGVIGSRAASERAYVAFFPLLGRALTHGSPRLWHVATFLAFWVLPQGLRRKMRGLCRGIHRDPATVSPV